MSEQLIVRLSGQQGQPIEWLLWSSSEQEIIGSGQLHDSQELSQLHSHAGGRPVITLVPSSEISFRRVEMPKMSLPRLLQALPYQLEEDLAEEIEELHFAILGQSDGRVDVAVVRHGLMELWNTQMEQAGLYTKKLLPDVLMLPLVEGQWSAIEVGQQWLVRQGERQGFAIESDLAPFMLSHADDPEMVLNTFSPLEFEVPLTVSGQGARLPMQLLAEGALAAPSQFNLMQGKYRPSRAWNKLRRQWMKPAILAGLLVIVAGINQWMMVNRLDNQNQFLKEQVVQRYKALFPNDRRVVNVKAQTNQHLNALRQGGDEGGVAFLPMMQTLAPIFSEEPSLKPSNLRFDLKRGELRFQVLGKDFQVFDRLNNKLSQQYDVEMGALNQKDSQVQGLVSIKEKS